MPEKTAFNYQKQFLRETGLFLLFLLLAFICYYKGYKGELVDDGLAGLVKFQNMGWQGFRQSFGFTSLYYFHDIFVLAVYGLAGKSAFGWFIVMILLHSLNAVLIFNLFSRFYTLMGVQRATLIAFAGSVLFLLSPYQTENVLWAATLHYSVTLSIFLLSAILLLNDLRTHRLRNTTIVTLGILYAVSLMTLEISLIFPLAYFILGAALILSGKAAVNIRQFTIKLLLPLLSLIAVYFIATRLIKGHWLPHYGETHLLNNDIKTYSTNFARYLVKTLGYVHFTSYGTRDLIYTFCNRWQLILPFEMVIPIIVFLLFRYTKKVAEANVFLILAGLAFVMLLPSLHMFFMYLFATVNDRLGYFFSLVIYQLLSLVLIALLGRGGMVFAGFFGLVGIWFLFVQDEKWQTAGTIQDTCVQTFKWPAAGKVYVLSAPTYYKDVYVFRNDERVPYAMDFYKRTKNARNIQPVVSFCSYNLSDSTHVEIKNDSTLQVSINTGGWLMEDGNGAVDYDSTDLSVRINKWKPEYEVVFHKKLPATVYIIYSGGGFKSIDNF